MARLLLNISKGQTMCEYCPFSSGDAYGSFVCNKENTNLWNMDCKEYDFNTLVLLSIED